ncbi:MAG: MFS transporter [Chloroflexota bacterium]|nr:MFS transporter [Chloroflexota bacterium]
MVATPLIETSAREKRENLFVLGATAFLRGVHVSVYGVIWQPFVLGLGASMPTLGLLNSLGGMNGIVTTIVQPFGGWLADRLGRKPFVAAASLAFLGGYALFWLSGLLNIWTLLLFGVVVIGATALANPARNSMTAESVRERHGSAFSALLVAGMLPGIIVPTLGGAFADRFGYTSLFPIFIAFEALALFLVVRYLRETRALDGEGMDWHAARRAMWRSILPPKGRVGFFCAVAGDSFFWSTGWGLLYGMVTETYHFSAEQLGIMASVMSLSWTLMQMPIGRYIDRRPVKRVMIVSELLGAPLMLLWITQSRFEIFAASQVLFALTAATWVPVINTYLTRSVSAAERAEAFGRLSMFRGLVAFPAPTLGGLLYAWGGMRAPLFVNLIGNFIVTAILIFFVREPKRAEEVVP